MAHGVDKIAPAELFAAPAARANLTAGPLLAPPPREGGPGDKEFSGENREAPAPPGQASRPGDGVALDNYDCSLCLRLLYEPVTLRCGHSFCGPCCANLVRAKHAKCPTCRRVLPIHVGGGSELATSLTLARLLRDVFPEEYEQRRVEIAVETAPAAAECASDVLPLFYLDPMLPRQRMRLNIFEPRYRLMVARCLEGSRVFGMLGVSHSRGQVEPMRIGVEVEICENEVQPDGRLHIEVRAKRRFEVRGETWQCDQYAVAHIVWLPAPDTDFSPASALNPLPREDGDAALALVQSSADDSPAHPGGSPPAPREDEASERQNRGMHLGGRSARAFALDLARLLQQAAALEKLVEEWRSLVESGGWQRFPGQLAKCLDDLGAMPPAPDAAGAAERALWVGALINPLPALGVAPEIRPLLLAASFDEEAMVCIATEGIQQSIRYLTPSPAALWARHLWRCLTSFVTRRANPGPALQAPDWLLVWLMLLNRLAPVLFIVALLFVSQNGTEQMTPQTQDL